MRFDEELKKMNIIDYNINPWIIKKATINKREKKIILLIVFKNSLKYLDYINFVNAAKKLLTKDYDDSKIVVNYENQFLKDSELDEYYNSIINKLLIISPKYNSFKNLEKKVIDGQYSIYVESDAKGVEIIVFDIEKEFLEFGINSKINIIYDESKSIADEIAKIDNEEFKKITDEIYQAQIINEKAELLSKTSKYKKTYSKEISNIKDIPNSQNALYMYKNEKGEPDFTINAEVFAIEVKKYPKSTRATIKVTDDTDSIMVTKWLRNQDEINAYEAICVGEKLKIFGTADYDQYAKNVVLNAKNIEIIGKASKEEMLDEEPVKRVELHCHTKMSNLDGINDAAEYIEQAIKWGHKAIAITDHGGVYSIPDIVHACEKKDIKPIFGIELPFIDDLAYHVAFTNEDIDLKTATYVVFDIETTGFSHEYDAIIEIAAVKMYQGSIIDKFEYFVNPRREISAKITELTTITNEMVKDAPGIEDVLPAFLEFSKDSILVAHNAIFDTSFIYANMRHNESENINFPIIDTLNAFRAMYYNDVKRFNLNSMCKYFKVHQDQHHRAIDDTKVTCECFMYILQDIYKRGITNYKDINKIINKDIFWRYEIPSHITLLVENQTGYKNLFKIISDTLTNHCYGEGRLLKSVLDENKSGILIGSSCVNGKVFNIALNGSDEELIKEMSYYDYIEVQPPNAYRHLFSMFADGKKKIEDTIIRIINAAKSIDKIVVATSDCHYLRSSSKHYRDILIASPQIGGGTHQLEKYSESPDMHFRTTREMLNEFSFINKELANEIVVLNTNKIADMISKVDGFKKEMFTPADDEFKDNLGVSSIVSEMKKIVEKNVMNMYGNNPHPIVKQRVLRELNSIISNGYSSVYYMSHLLVKKSLEDGYLVGSRGSVGSSIVATMMDITEINPLTPHYYCKNCHFQVFKMTKPEKESYGLSENEKMFEGVLDFVESGYDLPDAICPVCNEKLYKEGHDIPFETFLGFDGDKIPDIDLNFSGEYQAKAHEYVRDLMGEDHAFRSGTVSTIADKNAYGYVKGYCERKNIDLRSCEIDRIASKITGVKRSTGQHPGGIIVVPKAIDIYDVTPVQYPADNVDNSWRTTHFDYHSFENNLLKLDILGHDDPTMIKFFMDYVKLHPSEFPFSDPRDIPIDDKNVYRLFNGVDVIGLKPDDINSKVASFGVPEVGTNFVRQMLEDTLPRTFAQLVKISGLSHGTDVWIGNAKDLVLGKTEYGKIDFSDIIGCRDDIMGDLLSWDIFPKTAFEVMEFVRKGKVSSNPEKWNNYVLEMNKSNKVPLWYIWSCSKIKYLFPKAHATAYILMALRIAWFKLYSPVLFYSAYFSKRAPAFCAEEFILGKYAIKEKLRELNSITNMKVKEEDMITSLNVALEMVSRGIKFLPIDINKSDSNIFTIEDGNLRMPFIAQDGLGISVALDIVQKREENPFTSKKDVMRRTRLNQTLYEVFSKSGYFSDLPDEDEVESKGLFAFL